MLIFRQGPGYAGVFCFSAIPNLRVSEALKTEDQARQMQKEDHFPLHFLPTRAIQAPVYPDSQDHRYACAGADFLTGTTQKSLKNPSDLAFSPYLCRPNYRTFHKTNGCGDL